jgi:hypothetical protein
MGMRMKWKLFWGVLFMATAATPALADDPDDVGNSSIIAHARDRELTRQLNMDEQARVRERDARYAQGWAAVRTTGEGARHDNPARVYDRQMADYARNNAHYAQQMANWRRAVAACQAGEYSACGN